jgi:hypothetical protein
LVITSPECQTLHITDVHVRADEELTLAKETLRKADDVAKLEPYEVSAQTIEQMEKYIVNDTNAKPPAFSDANVDIPRGIDDVQPYYIFNSQTIEQSGATNVEDFLKNRLTMDTKLWYDDRRHKLDRLERPSRFADPYSDRWTENCKPELQWKRLSAQH